jgi:hypothetical protein
MLQFFVDIAEWLLSGFSFIYTSIIEFLNSILSGFFDFIFSSMPVSMQDGSALQLDMEQVDSFKGAIDTNLWDGLLWLFPIADVILILSAGYFVILSIRVVRWSLGLIPTLNLG